MGERLIKPYEISVWEDVLTQYGEDDYRFEEKKLAVIGSDTMTGFNKVYDPVFNKKSNGEKTLTFSLKYKYFDPYIGNEDIVNPFVALLTNERKVKLHYDGEWYEFIVKDHTETSDEYTWSYTCNDAFVLELSKNGYNITFDSELNNNQGTAAGLAKETLKDTDWQVGGADLLKQFVAEPVYKGTLVSTTGIEIINASNNGESIPTAGTDIYVFYSYIKNQSGKYVQFIIRDDERPYVIDDENVITDTNFRVITDLTYHIEIINEQDVISFQNENGVDIITVGEIENQYQVNRLVYNQQTTYDPVMQRTVDRYKVSGDNDLEIYKYTDYIYTTSNVLTNFITNGDNFNILEDGTLQGWNPYVDNLGQVNKLELVTRPELGTGKKLADITTLSQIEGFLKASPNGPIKIQNGKVYNTIYNSGFDNNASFIESVSKGDYFVFRWRAGYGDINNLTPIENMGLIVAKYTQDAPTRFGNYYKHVNENDIILRFEETIDILNNIITGGYIRRETIEGKVIENYVIDNVVQNVSTKYVYKDGNDNNNSYVWNAETSRFNTLEGSNFLPYYYSIAKATKTVPNSALKDSSQKYGIFIYYTGNNIDTQKTETFEEFTQRGVADTVNYYVHAIEGTTITFTHDGLDGNEVTLSFLAGNDYSNSALEFEYDSENEIISFWNDGRSHNFTVTYTYYVQEAEIVEPIYIQDIQLTRYIEDKSTDSSGVPGTPKPMLIGNVPTAVSEPKDYFYVKPKEGMTEEDVETYTSLEELEATLNLAQNSIIPLYNENSEKYLTITASQSNCFNILQTIAETFECWVDLKVEHDDRGYITHDDNGKLNKFVYLREYAGKDNYAGFKYGINLQSIERQINSDEIVTKLIVDQSQSDYVDEGFVSIGSAPSNLSGESYILNFDYYYNQGLLNRIETEADKLKFIEDVANINIELRAEEKNRRDLELAVTNLGSQRNVYVELIDTAQDMQNEALGDFEYLTGETYEQYKKNHNDQLDEFEAPDDSDDDEGGDSNEDSDEVSEDEKKPLTDNDTIIDILGQLYVCSSTINNYSGLLTNLDQEYWAKRKELRGSENYSVKIWTGKDYDQQRHIYIELSDYLVGFVATINGSPYPSTVSKKYFDVISNATEVTLTAPENYTIDEEGRTKVVTINDLKELRFKIVCAETVPGVEDKIKELQEEKDELTKAFFNKYSRFIQEGTWSSTDYIDSELYYLDALQVSITSAQPTVSYTINVAEVSRLEGLENYNFDAGDKSYVEDTEFFGWAMKNGVMTPAREEVIVSEVEWHLDDPSQNIITVQNYKTRFEDLFQRINATVQTVQYNEATYAKMSTLLDANGTINQDVLVASLNKMAGQTVALTSDGSVLIQKDAIHVRNLQNPANYVILNSEGIRISSDGGNTWRTAINGEGIDIGAVYTGTLNTKEVIIGNKDNPSFRWDKAGISAYKSDGTTDDGQGHIIENYDLQTFVRYDQYGLYGIKDSAGFKAQSLQDVLDEAHFAVTWDGFFIKNSYEGGGRVEITSDNDFRVLNDPLQQGNFQEKIKIGALEWGDGITSPDAPGATALPTLYGIRIKNDLGEEVMKTDDDGNINITGTINATGGNFSDIVTVGKQNSQNPPPWIEINGANSSIYTSNYSDGATQGWMINKDGDAVFNNITARGAIKTAVFEYAEIQAVGGIFIFRPSSTIKAARVDGNNLILKVEKPLLFAKVSYTEIDDPDPNANPQELGWYEKTNYGYQETTDTTVQVKQYYRKDETVNGSWCKVSNYIADGVATDSTIQNILLTNGLTHVYQVIAINTTTKEVTLSGAAVMVEGPNAVTTLEDLEGGALIDMGRKDGSSNYGIGVNSSDNTVNLPARAISLFETVVDETKEPKVTYKYRGILGTLPNLPATSVDTNIYNNMIGTQGIYTDNMYLGDLEQYLAFYTDEHGNKKLKICAAEIMFEISDEHGQGSGHYQNVADIEAEGVPGPAGQDAIRVEIDPIGGNFIKRGQVSTSLIAHVYEGINDITNQFNHFTWYRRKSDGTRDPSWSTQETSNQLSITTADVDESAVFVCEVTITR